MDRIAGRYTMRGAPARAIQELAGHRDLSTSQQYMHLSPAAIKAAIELLEEPAPVQNFGDIVETAPGQEAEMHPIDRVII